MKKHKPSNNMAQRLARDTRGATFVEYIILVGLVALFCIGAYKTFADAVTAKVDDQATKIGDIGNSTGN
jgi:Flp pilus assembly pilin Flp